MIDDWRLIVENPYLSDFIKTHVVNLFTCNVYTL